MCLVLLIWLLLIIAFTSLSSAVRPIAFNHRPFHPNLHDPSMIHTDHYQQQQGQPPPPISAKHLLQIVKSGGAAWAVPPPVPPTTVECKVYPPGSYKLLFWDKFRNRFFGDLEQNQLFVVDPHGNGHLKFKSAALKDGSEESIGARFFGDKLRAEYTCVNSTFNWYSDDKLFEEADHIHAYMFPLSKDGYPLPMPFQPQWGVVEQTDVVINTRQLPHVIHYHGIDKRHKLVTELFERWLFGEFEDRDQQQQMTLLSQGDCFFLEAYLNQMFTELNSRSTLDKEMKDLDKEELQLYAEMGSVLSRAMDSGHLAQRALMVEDAIVQIRLICGTISELNTEYRTKYRIKLHHWDGNICPHLEALWVEAVNGAIERWLMIGMLRIGDENTLSEIVEELSQEMSSNAERLKMMEGPKAMLEDMQNKLKGMPMLAKVGQMLELARNNEPKWAQRVVAVSGMLEHIRTLCLAKIRMQMWCPNTDQQIRELDAWNTFCTHLREARNVQVCDSIDRWLMKDGNELGSVDTYVLDNAMANLVRRMDPYSPNGGQMIAEDIELLAQIGHKLMGALDKKLLANRMLRVPSFWQQLWNICAVIHDVWAKNQGAAVDYRCWEYVCPKMDEIWIGAVFGALERWLNDAPRTEDTVVIHKVLQQLAQMVQSIGNLPEGHFDQMGESDQKMMVGMGSYLSEALNAKVMDKNAPVLRPLLMVKMANVKGMSKTMWRLCNGWPSFHQKIRPQMQGRFMGWTKICKIILKWKKETKEEVPMPPIGGSDEKMVKRKRKREEEDEGNEAEGREAKRPKH